MKYEFLCRHPHCLLYNKCLLSWVCKPHFLNLEHFQLKNRLLIVHYIKKTIIVLDMVLIKIQKKNSLAKFFEILLKTGVLPLVLDKDTNQLKYKIFSKPVYLSWFYGVLVITGFAFFNIHMFGITPWATFWDILLSSSNKTDALAYFALNIFVLATIPLGFPMFLRDIVKISSILTLNENLKWPKHGVRLVFVSSLNCLAVIVWSILTFESAMLSRPNFGNYDITWMIIGNSTIMLFQQVNLFILLLFSLTWIESFTFICQDIKTTNILKHSLLSMEIFRSLQNGLGRTFLIVFSTFQFLTILSLYMSISTMFFGTSGILYNVSISMCYVIMVTYNATILYSLTVAAEEAFESIKTFETYLVDLISQENTNSSVKIRSILRETDNVRPLNGNGYFELKKETLTSIFSTIVTYLIILLQFRNT